MIFTWTKQAAQSPVINEVQMERSGQALLETLIPVITRLYAACLLPVKTTS
jgi:hypothetical protein